MKTNREEDLIEIKLRHDMELERKRFELEEEVKRAEIKNEEKRMELELQREKRLSEEAYRRDEIYKNMQTNMVMDMLQKHNNN